MAPKSCTRPPAPYFFFAGGTTGFCARKGLILYKCNLSLLEHAIYIRSIYIKFTKWAQTKLLSYGPISPSKGGVNLNSYDS